MKEEYLKEGLKIVSTLNSLTYQAYIVGGAVRDYIMQNDFVDIDIGFLKSLSAVTKGLNSEGVIDVFDILPA